MSMSCRVCWSRLFFFFFQAEDGIRDYKVTGVQTCALPICLTTSMAEELREHGIRVSLISPGSVATEFQPATGHDASKKLRPEDVAHAAEMILLQGAQSFLSEVDLRPLRKR